MTTLSGLSGRSDLSGTAGTASYGVGDGRIADVDRRFYAFAVDQLIAWTV